MKIEKNIFSGIGFANGFITLILVPKFPFRNAMFYMIRLSAKQSFANNLLPSKGVPLGQTGPPRRIGKQGGRSRKTASAYSLAENHIGFAKGFRGFDKIASPLARLANDKTAAGYALAETTLALQIQIKFLPFAFQGNAKHLHSPAMAGSQFSLIYAFTLFIKICIFVDYNKKICLLNNEQ